MSDCKCGCKPILSIQPKENSVLGLKSNTPANVTISEIQRLAPGKDATINGVNALTIDTSHGISGIQDGSTFTISGEELENAIDTKQDILTAGENIQIEDNVISATDTTYTAGEGISIENNVISNTRVSAEWGNIIGDIDDQTDLKDALDGLQSQITDNHDEIGNIGQTIGTYGDIVTHNVSEFATSAQGALADSALQSGDNVSELVNNAGYITGVAWGDITGTLSSQTDLNSALSAKQDTLSAGTGIDITSNTVSVADPTLVNNGTGTKALAVGKTSQSTAEGGVAVGYGAQANSTYATAVGYDTRASNTNTTVIGKGAKATQARAIAIGSGAEATAQDAIAIKGINNTANTFQVYTYNMLDMSTGLIPDARISTNIARTSAIPTVDQTYDGTSTNAQSGVAVASAVATETTNRESADNNLQSQIDAIVSSSDVFDIVATYADLQAYDISTVPVNDIIKVLVDSTHDNSATYYRCVESGGVKSWSYIGSEGAYYTKSESDSRFVPQTRTVNSKALSSDITLTASDVGALPSSTVIPTVNDATLTIQKNGTTLQTFSANASSNVTCDISVPTDTSDLTNGAGYITASSIPTDYYTKTEIDSLIPQPTKVPVVYYQPTDSYCYDGLNNRFYGSHVTEKLYLVKPKTSGTEQVVDMSTTFSLSFTLDYKTAPSSTITVAEIITSYSAGKGVLLQLNSTGLYYKNNVTGTTITGTRALTAGNSYDVKVEYDGTHIIISYKLSSDANYTQINSTTCTAGGSNYNYVAVGMNSNYGNMSLSSVVLTNGANTLYSYTAGKIALDYDSSLTLNSSNQLKVVVDQTYDGTSANAQSGVAIAGELANYAQSSSLATVATSGDYDDLLNKPTIPTVNNATLTIQKNGVDVQTFTANASTNATANISVPTDTSDLSNGAGFITGVAWGDITGALSDQTDLRVAIDAKQDVLTSANAGTDISITNGGTVTVVESGTGSVTLTNAVASGLNYVKLYGGLTQSASPTPTSPASYTCNNGVIGWDKVNNVIVTTGTTETVEDELSNTATATRLLSFDSDHTDVQEILTGAVTRKVGIKVLDGTETTSWTVQSNRAYTLKSNIGMSNCLQPSGTGTNSLKCSHFSSNTINNYGNVLFNYTMSNIGVSDVTSWNNYLATQYANGTPVIVIYPLNADVSESVTAQTLSTISGTNELEITQASIASLPIEASFEQGTNITTISFNNSSGYITGITSGDVTTALGYTPYDASNPSGYITGITSGDVTTALGYTPYNSSNPSGYISSASVSSLSDVTLTSVSNGDVLIYNSTSQKWENGSVPTPTVDQTYDGTSANAQSGVAIAGAGFLTSISSADVTGALGYTPLQSSDISNMVTTDTAQNITAVKTLVADGTNTPLVIKDDDIDVTVSPPTTGIYRQGLVITDVNNNPFAAFSYTHTTPSGILEARIQAWSHNQQNSATIYVGYDSSDNVRTYAPACDASNSILTTTSLSTSSTYTRLTLGNGVKIAAEYISGISGSSDYTWNYGITFTEQPMILITRRSTATSSTAIDIWTRGAAGTSSCKIYSTLGSGSTYNVYVMAIGH